MKYDKNVLAKMKDEMFHFNNMVTGEYSTFYFKSNGDVWSNESCRTYPTMSQMFKALHVPNMRPSKCLNNEGYPFPEVYEDYIDVEIDQFEDFEPSEPIKTNADIAQDIFHGFLSGEISIFDAVDQAFAAVKERCGLSEKFLTEIETTIKLAKLVK